MTDGIAAQIQADAVARLSEAAASTVRDEDSVFQVHRASRTTNDDPTLTTIGIVPRSDLVRVLVVEDRPKEIVVAEEFGHVVDGVMTLVKRNVYVTLKEPSVVATAISGGL